MAQLDPGLARLRQVIVAKVGPDPSRALQECRGRGVGRALVEQVVEEARREGRRGVRVHSWCSSRAFYSALGFQEVGEVVEGVVPWIPMLRII